MIQHMQVISVRLRSIPLKQSTYLVPRCACFSTALVSCIWFSEAIMPASNSVSDSSSVCLRKRRSESFAFFELSCRTSHHGLSGAITTATNIGTGKAHCSPKGVIHAHFVGSCTFARRTVAAKSCPITQQAFTYLSLSANSVFTVLIRT